MNRNAVRAMSLLDRISIDALARSLHVRNEPLCRFAPTSSQIVDLLSLSRDPFAVKHRQVAKRLRDGRSAGASLLGQLFHAEDDVRLQIFVLISGDTFDFRLRERISPHSCHPPSRFLVQIAGWAKNASPWQIAKIAKPTGSKR